MTSSNQPTDSSSSAHSQRATQERTGFVIEELPEDISGEDNWEEDSNETNPMMSNTDTALLIPDLYTNFPLIRDILITNTSEVQDETVQECLPYLTGQSGQFTTYNRHGVPNLDRARHSRFLHKSLQDLPSAYVTADAGRPWFFYWTLCGLRTLGEDVSSYRERLISTVQPMHNVTGGFGGGHGQMSHLATTYAIVLALAMVGGGAAMELIDRKAMWRWLGTIKQRDGGFQMSIGGEEDVRGAYCAAVIISLLDLPLELPHDSPARSCDTDTLLTGVPEYVSRCQTYEGGISSHPDTEAHAAYTFCGLACLCILGDPHVIIPKYLNVPALMSWLSARQYAPEGGFSGRTNKLVDGCYSHWVGACWPLIISPMKGTPTPIISPQDNHEYGTSNYPLTGTPLFNKEGLIRYILCACQDTSRRGGMRDKPSTRSDGYHTCYVLAGLSSVQHTWTYTLSAPSPGVLGNMQYAYKWTAEKFRTRPGEEEVFDEVDRVVALHPIFVIPEGVAEETRAYFVAKGGF